MVFLLLMSLVFFLFLITEVYKRFFWFTFRLDRDLPDGRYRVESQMFYENKTFVVFKNEKGKIFYVFFHGKKEPFLFFAKQSKNNAGDVFEPPEVSEVFY